MKWLLPCHAYTLRSRLSRDMVVQKIAEDTEPLGIFRSAISTQNIPIFNRQTSLHKYFEGDYDEGGFRIRKVIEGRNNFRPLVVGKIEPDVSGALVRVHMRPGLYAIGFIMVFIFAISNMAFLAAQQNQADAAVVPAGMALFVYAMACFGFWYHAGDVKTYLEVILEAKEVRGE